MKPARQQETRSAEGDARHPRNATARGIALALLLALPLWLLLLWLAHAAIARL